MPKKKTDFLDAHQRHWQDAELLFQQQRWANADHLYGFSAECGLKALILKTDIVWNSGSDMPVDKDVRKRFFKHINELWDEYNIFVQGKLAAHYVIPTANPFDNNWYADDRYAPGDQFNQQDLANHRAAADSIRQLIKKAQRDGLL